MGTPGLFFATNRSQPPPPERRGAAPPAHAFAEDAAGSGYFRSDYHHRYVVGAIVRHLAKGCSFVLVTGEPGADGELVTRFLDEEKPERYRASLVTCRPGMDFHDLVRAYGGQLGLRPEGESGGLWTLLSHLMLETRNGITRVLVLEHAQALDARSFDELIRFTQLDDPHLMPVVLLAAPAFAARLETPPLEFLNSAMAGRLALDRLEPEEVGAFIRYQLNALADGDGTLFPPETVAAITQSANGDPAMVNRLARQVVLAARADAAESEAAAPAGTAGSDARSEIVAPAASVLAELKAAEELRVQGAAGRAIPLVLDPADSPAPAAAPPRRRRASAIVAGLYVLAVALAGAALLYLLVPEQLGDTAPVAAVAVPPVEAPAAAAQEAAAIEPAAAPPSLSAPAPAAAAPELAAPAAPSTLAPVAAATRGETAPAGSNASVAALAPAAPLPPPAALDAPIAALAPAPPPPPAAAPRPPSAEVVMLVRRGGQLLAGGDIVSARRFFERAAASGDGEAACGLGKSFDPLYLRQLGARGLAGDAATAIDWYRKAAVAGNAEALARLERLRATYPQ